MIRPKEGEIWKWYEDGSKSHERYGSAICLGYRDDWDGACGPQGYVIFHFAEKGVMNIPVEMVKKFMHKIT